MKAKTRSAVKSRVRKTGTGKIKVMKAARKHLLLQKSKKQKAKGKRGKTIMVSKSMEKTVLKCMPHL